ncbi:20294_t:CDS:2 [Gigaspora margarita]|uniref:20294_t:CDS:1 n=1 Tax=Gigaspora margarita TaxID=4874 RepID=A0ABN7UMG2_GIGMA|nr:20294_t:CDS:2 [Gigaspora margarita]
MLVIFDIQEFEIPEFFRFVGETSKAMGDRFEWFSAELLRRYFERLGVRVTQTGGPNDKDRDIVIEICGYIGVIQCKAWFAKYISRKEVDEFRSVVSDGRFDFGVVVGVLEEKISDEAYNSAERSEHDIIVTTYRKIQEFRALEDRRRFLENRRRFLEDRYGKILPIPEDLSSTPAKAEINIDYR